MFFAASHIYHGVLECLVFLTSVFLRIADSCVFSGGGTECESCSNQVHSNRNGSKQEGAGSEGSQCSESPRWAQPGTKSHGPGGRTGKSTNTNMELFPPGCASVVCSPSRGVFEATWVSAPCVKTFQHQCKLKTCCACSISWCTLLIPGSQKNVALEKEKTFPCYAQIIQLIQLFRPTMYDAWDVRLGEVAWQLLDYWSHVFRRSHSC